MREASGEESGTLLSKIGTSALPHACLKKQANRRLLTCMGDTIIIDDLVNIAGGEGEGRL